MQEGTTIDEFIGLSFDSRGRGEFSLETHLCVGGRGFGGVVIAAIASVFRELASDDVVSIGVQFLRGLPAGARIGIEADLGTADRRGVRHGVASCLANGELVCIAQGVVASPEAGATRRWAGPPSLPGPEQCTPRAYRFGQQGLNAELDVRVAPGGQPLEDGRSLLWARLRREVDLAIPLLGLLSDHVAFAVGEAIEGRPIARTLEASLRAIQRPPTPWVSLDVRVLAAAGPVVHGLVDLWSEDGELLATGAQSLMLLDRPAPV